jgi:hypothetical protein
VAAPSSERSPWRARALRAASTGLLGAVTLASCNPGAGAGEVRGRVTVRDCGLVDAPFDLSPDFFIAEGQHGGLHVRIQRGSDLPLRSDGVWIDVLSSRALLEAGLGAPVPVTAGSREDAVKVSLYLHATCPADRGEAPVVLEGIGGTVTFSELYDPDADGPPAIVGALDSVTLVDPAAPDERRATIAGRFDFLYNRGRPAQRFP